MKKNLIYTLLLMTIFSNSVLGFRMQETIIDFTYPISNMKIVTDATERAAGLSHAYIGYQNSQYNKSHYFFAHLEPQPSGAAFASFKIEQKYNLDSSTSICLNGKSLNERAAIFQLIIDTTESKSQGFTYKHDFLVEPNKPINKKMFFDNFSATRRGEPLPNAPYIDINHINSIGLRIIGRADRDSNIFQKGLYGLQLFNIKNCDR